MHIAKDSQGRILWVLIKVPVLENIPNRQWEQDLAIKHQRSQEPKMLLKLHKAEAKYF